jgi:hypothetical protein
MIEASTLGLREDFLENVGPKFRHERRIAIAGIKEKKDFLVRGDSVNKN